MNHWNTEVVSEMAPSGVSMYLSAGAGHVETNGPMNKIVIKGVIINSSPNDYRTCECEVQAQCQRWHHTT